MALQIIPAVVHCQSWGQPPGQLGGERDRMKETGFALDFSVAAGLGIEKALSNTKIAPLLNSFVRKPLKLARVALGNTSAAKCACVFVSVCAFVRVCTCLYTGICGKRSRR